MCCVKSEHWGSREEAETGDWNSQEGFPSGRKGDKERPGSEYSWQNALGQWSPSCGPYTP